MYDWQKQELIDALRELMELADDYDAPREVTETLDEAHDALHEASIEEEEDNE